MTFSAFTEQLLDVLYNESETGCVGAIRIGDLITKYKIDYRGHWIERLVEEWDGDGLGRIEAFIGNPFDWDVEITAKGLRHIEERRARRSETILGLSDTSTASPGLRFESSQWTGLSKEISPSFQEKLIYELSLSERKLESLMLGNSEKAQVRSYIIAAKLLAESPNPPADIIWDIISRANMVAGVAGLFVAILALFVH
jgi:hypothetical protein